MSLWSLPVWLLQNVEGSSSRYNCRVRKRKLFVMSVLSPPFNSTPCLHITTFFWCKRATEKGWRESLIPLSRCQMVRKRVVTHKQDFTNSCCPVLQSSNNYLGKLQHVLWTFLVSLKQLQWLFIAGGTSTVLGSWMQLQWLLIAGKLSILIPK